MHPYEFDNAHDFWVKMSDMDELNISFLKKIYFQFRQHQWHSFNNLTILKLKNTLAVLPNKGRIDSYLEIEDS